MDGSAVRPVGEREARFEGHFARRSEYGVGEHGCYRYVLSFPDVFSVLTRADHVTSMWFPEFGEVGASCVEVPCFGTV